MNTPPTFPTLFNKRPATVEVAENEVRVVSGDTSLMYDKELVGLRIRVQGQDDVTVVNRNRQTGRHAHMAINHGEGTTMLKPQLPEAALDITFRMGLEAIAEAARLNSATFPKETGVLARKIVTAHQGRLT